MIVSQLDEVKGEHGDLHHCVVCSAQDASSPVDELLAMCAPNRMEIMLVATRATTTPIHVKYFDLCPFLRCSCEAMASFSSSDSSTLSANGLDASSSSFENMPSPKDETK
jgi:hypothetical protein